MASRILLPRFSPLLAGGLCATSIIAAPLLLRPLYTQRLLCDGPSAKPIINPDWSYSKQAKTPVVKSDGHLNPNALKEISTGSILGLLGGLAVSVFSKPLAVVLGLLVCGVQVCYPDALLCVSGGLEGACC